MQSKLYFRSYESYVEMLAATRKQKNFEISKNNSWKIPPASTL